MSGGFKVHTAMSKLDELLNEYAEKRRLGKVGDIYSKDEIESESVGLLNCRFKDNCYAFRSNMGTCPCELNE